jgi:3-phosphoshikimate 1-carboxyvinyltransferase
MDSLIVSHSGAAFKATVSLPTSKSISNRALIIEALTGEKLPLANLSDSADTRLMRKLLLAIRKHDNKHQNLVLDCENAGTVFRFLTAFLAIQPGIWELTGSDRMKERPVGPLVEALRVFGAHIEYLGKEGYPPIRIQGNPLKGQSVAIDPGLSSQFISALLLIGPMLENGLEIRLTKKPSSVPYIHMTLGLLRHFGIESSFLGDRLEVLPQRFRNIGLTIEPDWSAASFWYTIVALSRNGSVFLPGMEKKSLQGDAILPEIYNALGVKSKFEKEGLSLVCNGSLADRFFYDFTNQPDLLQPVLAACAGLGIKAEFTGIESLRIKETDRIHAMVKELNHLGIRCRTLQNHDQEYETSIELEEPVIPHDLKKAPSLTTIQTYGDHRMAMAFAPLSQRYGPMEIVDPDVVVKSYPGFWKDLEKAGFVIQSGRRQQAEDSGIR